MEIDDGGGRNFRPGTPQPSSVRTSGLDDCGAFALTERRVISGAVAISWRSYVAFAGAALLSIVSDRLRDPQGVVPVD